MRGKTVPEDGRKQCFDTKIHENGCLRGRHLLLSLPMMPNDLL